MRSRLWALGLLAAVAMLVLAGPAGAKRSHVPHHDLSVKRVIVAVGPGHPIQRDQPLVVQHRTGVAVRVRPTMYLPLVAWRSVPIARPAPARVVWRDSEPLSFDDDWTETTFDCNQAGSRLYLELVSGRVQLDFIEVVFENGDCQVVDFSNRSHAPGVYSLLDLGEVRTVDHVRVIARSRSDVGRIALMLRQ